MSEYTRKLDALVDWARANPGTGGARAIRKVVMDLEGEGPIGELLFSVDQELFDRVIDLLVEFRATGRSESFNAIHSQARERLLLGRTAKDPA